MAIKTKETDLQRITVSLSKELVERLNQVVSPQQRSQFISEAIQEQLAILEQAAALDEAAGVWSEDNHPDMRTEEDIDRWVNELRRSWGVTASERLSA